MDFTPIGSSGMDTSSHRDRGFTQKGRRAASPGVIAGTLVHGNLKLSMNYSTELKWSAIVETHKGQKWRENEEVWRANVSYADHGGELSWHGFLDPIWKTNR